MLVLGMTVLAPRLRGLIYVAYWLGCMALTGLAALTAVLDLRATGQRVREAQRELLSAAIDEVSRERRRAEGRAPTSGLSKPTADASIPPASDRKSLSP